MCLEQTGQTRVLPRCFLLRASSSPVKPRWKHVYIYNVWGTRFEDARMAASSGEHHGGCNATAKFTSLGDIRCFVHADRSVFEA